MAKSDRDQRSDRGNTLLSEWGVAADADADALGAFAGRDPVADWAIAERLVDGGGDAAVGLLQQLERSTDKHVRKEAKRSLYRLQQRGVEVTRAPAAPPRLAPPEAGIEGYLSAIDGNGDQLVWLTKSQAGSLLHAFAVINDRIGLKEAEIAETTRKGLRALRAELVEKHGLQMIDADWRTCDFLIDRAFRLATERSASGGDYPGIRARFTREPVRPCDNPIRSKLDAEVVAADAKLLERSGMLLAEPELRTWLLSPDALQSYVDEWLEIVDSPLVLSEEQQRERLGQLAAKAVEELFGGADRELWVQRAEMLAYFFHETRRPDAARDTFAAALALARSEQGGKDVPLFENLVKTCLAAYTQMAEQRRQKEKDSSLIVTPGEAAREAAEAKRGGNG